MILRIIHGLNICALVLLAGCFSKSHQIKRSLMLQSQPGLPIVRFEPGAAYPITIWIHGTRMFPPGVLDNYFHSEPGLHHFSFTAPCYKVRRVAQDIIASDPLYYEQQGFYIFGWSGKLSFNERKRAAQELYTQLKALRHSYREQFGHEPTIRIITHSHGGNVALNLAAVKDPEDIDFVIDELVVLACPVQTKTARHAQDLIFKKIYSFYSYLDMLQVLDPQGLYTFKRSRTTPTFSEHQFACWPSIEQIELNLDWHGCLHIDFIRQEILKNFGAIMRVIKQWQHECKEQGIDWGAADKALYLMRKTKS